IAATAGTQLGALIGRNRLLEDLGRQLHRAEALQRIAADISSKLDLDQILAGLVDHAMVLFGADRGAVFLIQPDKRLVVPVARNLSASYVSAMADFPTPSLPADAVAQGRTLFATGYRDDPRSRLIRAAVVQEGYDTICCAPLLDASGLLGLLILYHDARHEWTDEELETAGALATQGSVAIRTAQNFAQMATWAAQLQSIQQLGVRLSGLTSVREIGLAIATELHQLIDYHNVRVYRLYDDELAPVAMQGQVGEYFDETPEQLRVRVDQGVTGWVVRHRVAQSVPDAAHDPRAMTIPGTEADLDESMLLAPMLYEDQVLGVLVLSKLGLHQFRDDDLRLLVIYASFAAQAMANADATERLREQSATLERQLRSQRDLLEITESILTTLDPRTVLDRITDRLGSLVRYDNVSIELYDRSTHRLRPLTARGIHAEDYLLDWEPGEQGLATWVIDHGEPQLVQDELADPRVNHLATPGPVEGSLIVVPLRGRGGVTGVLSLERLGTTDRFSDEEFELVKLFGAQVSIALQNAETHHETEIRAQTDDLTGLLNQGTFHEWLGRSVAEGSGFSLIMLDLDDFKAVNDRMGHAAGDELLHRLAAAIVAAGRESDRVFRYGGDEFTLLLPRTDAAGAQQVAERIRAALNAVALPGGRGVASLEVSCSVGIATFPDDGASAAEILIAADRACYVAKRSGRDRVALAPEGLALAAEFSLQEPTPVDTPSAA
ncbi:MAG: GAF domain-containing protein, partial [Candidatus Limnocylindrales bacterium]